MKYWASLLNNQRKNDKSGLTIPFIIGSQMFLQSDLHKKQNINDLIIDIIENSPFEINLRLCIGLQTLILERRNLKNQVYYPTFKNGNQQNFSVAKFFEEDLGNTIEDIILRLEDEFFNPIRNKKFSAKPDYYQRKPIWNEFSQNEDVQFIKKSFNIPD